MTDEQIFNINNNTNVTINIQSDESRHIRNNVYSNDEGLPMRLGAAVNDNFILGPGKNTEVNNEAIDITKLSTLSQGLNVPKVVSESCSSVLIDQINKKKEESTA
ncbi:unnamed protein product [Ceratitis capitata]|uniref:(Mediterranean fruit fly) hypothetical protein n=1 Tax=Ceratitis capitata TaxID=7213 RepID=W8BAZ1_CERCA|nr:unnamed protein product [Ceratitis capitata]